MKPVRITLSRKAGWRMPPNTVKVARPGPWGNPWRVGKATYGDGTIQWAVFTEGAMSFHPTKEEAVRVAVARFEANAKSDANAPWRELARLALRGKNLACFCKDGPCHADVLLELANP